MTKFCVLSKVEVYLENECFFFKINYEVSVAQSDKFLLLALSFVQTSVRLVQLSSWLWSNVVFTDLDLVSHWCPEIEMLFQILKICNC